MSEKILKQIGKELGTRRQQIEKKLEQKKKEIASELKPFFDSVMSMDRESAEFKLFLNAYKYYIGKMSRSLSITEFMMADLQATVENLAKGRIREMNPRDVVNFVFYYFSLIEVWGNSACDFLVMLLVANKRAFHIERSYKTPRIKHAHSMEDLEEERVPLTTKLNFLMDNGISSFASTIDNQFRNDIAHLNFNVEENMIYVRGKPTLLTALLGGTEFLEANNTLMNYIERFSDKTYRSSSSKKGDRNK